VIAANEAEQLVEAHSGAIPVKYPQEDGLHSGELQTIKNLVDHIEGNALPPKFWSNPDKFEETLIRRSIVFASNTSNADLFISRSHPSYADVPVTPGEFPPPPELIISALLLVGCQESFW
jgi:hypothetical protein